MAVTTHVIKKVNAMSFPAQPTNVSIPSRHDLLGWDQIDDFAAWIDAQLVELEREFADFVTRESRHTSFQSSRERSA